MSYFIDICLVCLKHSDNFTFIKAQDTNGTSIEDKLKYFVPELELKSSIPKYICAKCGSNLSKGYKSKQKYLKNIVTYEKYAQQIISKGGCYRYLFVVINPDFVYEEADISDQYILEPQIEIELLDEVISNEFECIGKNEPTENDNEKLYVCGTCNKSFKNLQSLKRHRFIHTNRYSCEICKKSFGRLQHLKNHQLIHTAEKPFICEVCNIPFKHVISLKRHNLVHIGEAAGNESYKVTHTIGTGRPFTCEVCKKSFGQSYHLKKHQLTHTDKKPHACEICNRAFRQFSTLKQHKLLHTGEKPFTCDVCNKSFRQLQILRQHKLLHTGEKPYTCEICNESFRQLNHVNRHRLIHTEQKSFVCNI